MAHVAVAVYREDRAAADRRCILEAKRRVFAADVKLETVEDVLHVRGVVPPEEVCRLRRVGQQVSVAGKLRKSRIFGLGGKLGVGAQVDLRVGAEQVVVGVLLGQRVVAAQVIFSPKGEEIVRPGRLEQERRMHIPAHVGSRAGVHREHVVVVLAAHIQGRIEHEAAHMDAELGLIAHIGRRDLRHRRSRRGKRCADQGQHQRYFARKHLGSVPFSPTAGPADTKLAGYIGFLSNTVDRPAVRGPACQYDYGPFGLGVLPPPLVPPDGKLPFEPEPPPPP